MQHLLYSALSIHESTPITKYITPTPLQKFQNVDLPGGKRRAPFVEILESLCTMTSLFSTKVRMWMRACVRAANTLLFLLTARTIQLLTEVSCSARNLVRTRKLCLFFFFFCETPRNQESYYTKNTGYTHGGTTLFFIKIGAYLHRKHTHSLSLLFFLALPVSWSHFSLSTTSN